ncbi:MAG: alanine racemase [Verrucomicrobiaceae bacterium]|nr:MAG: alanine racemase [Verrucomicrobiaceae bacterium]
MADFLFMTGKPAIRRDWRTWVEVDLGAVRKNALAAQQCLHTDERGIVAVVKADGYGLGMVPVARAVEDVVRAFAVANVSEAMALREGGITSPVYVLGPALPWERTALAEGADFCPSVSDAAEARAYARAAEAAGRKLAVHVVVDTGMGRMGALPDMAAEVVWEVAASRWLELDSVASHFPSADTDRHFTTEQEQGFRHLIQSIQEAGVPLERTQIANSAGLTAYARRGGTELARAGLILYGVPPVEECRELLSPVASWFTRITQVRTLPAGWGVSYGRTYVTSGPTRVATLAVGYADGYPRQLSGQGGQVLIGGKRCPVLGRVTMDQLMVDVSALPEESTVPGTEAVLFGRQGEGEITVDELAAWSGTISWDILTGLGPRVQRVYLSVSEEEAGNTEG